MTYKKGSVQKKHWSEDPKDLGTNQIFHLIFMAFFILCIAVGAKYTGMYGETLKSELSVFIGITMLIIQNYFTWDYISHLKRKNKTKTQRKK